MEVSVTTEKMEEIQEDGVRTDALHTLSPSKVSDDDNVDNNNNDNSSAFRVVEPPTGVSIDRPESADSLGELSGATNTDGAEDISGENDDDDDKYTGNEEGGGERSPVISPVHRTTTSEGRGGWWNENDAFNFESEKVKDNNDQTCYICGERGELVCCDGPCKRSFKLQCLGMKPEDLPEGKWLCPECGNTGKLPPRPNAEAKERAREKLDELMESRVSKEGKAAVAARRGLDFIGGTVKSSDTDMFEKIGNEALEFFMTLTSNTHDETSVRSRAMSSAEKIAQRWLNVHKPEIMQASESSPRTSRMVALSIGVLFLEQVAMSHLVKKQLDRSIRNRNVDPASYLGFDPRLSKKDPGATKNPIPVLNKVHKFLSNALRHAYFLDSLEFEVGANFVNVFYWMKLVRPYVDRDKMDSAGQYEEQLDLVVNVVLTLTDHGKLSIIPDYLPYEFEWLTRDVNFTYWMDAKPNPRALASVVRACRYLGVPADQKSSPPMERAIHWLLDKQRADGGWDVPADRMAMLDDRSRRREEMTATIACVHALLTPKFRGYGPSNLAMLKMLRNQAKELRASGASGSSSVAAATARKCPCGIDRLDSSSPALLYVQHLYGDGGAGSSDALNIAERGTNRLEELLLRRKEEQVDKRNRKRSIGMPLRLPRKRKSARASA
eukprot:g1889.t1